MDRTDTIVKSQMELKRPNMWTCVFLNDNYTPMEFVTEVLVNIFNQTKEAATIIMLRVHREGKCNVGHYPRDIAEQKASDAVLYAIRADHPLQVIPTQII